MDPRSRRSLPWPPMSYWVRVAVVVALTLYVLQLLRSVLNIVILVVIAAVLAIGLDPAVRLLSRRMRRGHAVTVIFAAFAVSVLVFASLVLPPLVRQGSDLSDDVPRYARQLAQRDDVVGRYFRENDVVQNTRAFIADLPTNISQSFSTILGIAGQVTGTLFNAATVAVLMIYFMLSLPTLRRTSARLFSPDRRQRAESVIDESITRIGGYVWGNIVTSLICGVLAVIALFLLDVPFAAPLGVWAGIADLIPAVGAYLGAVPAVIVAFFQSPVVGLLVLVYFLLYQQFENYFVVPKVMQGAVNLSPAAVIVSTLIGGSLFGFAGALLALPVAATIKVILYEVWLKERLAEGDVVTQERTEVEAPAARQQAAAVAPAGRLDRLKDAVRRRTTDGRRERLETEDEQPPSRGRAVGS